MAIQQRDIVEVTILGAGDTNSISLPSVAAVYTNTFNLKDAEYFAVGYKVTAVTGSSNVTIVLEQSPVPAVTEYAADDNFNIPVGSSDVVTNLTVRNTWNYTAINPIAFPYGRFKITGSLLNSTSIVSIKLLKQVNG